MMQIDKLPYRNIAKNAAIPCVTCVIWRNVYMDKSDVAEDTAVIRTTVSLRKMLCLMRPVDHLNISFLSFLLILTLTFKKNLPMFDYLISLYSSLILILFILIYLKGRFTGRLLIAIHEIIFPLMIILLCFDSLGYVVHYINPVDKDPTLIRIDYMLFGTNPTVFLERFVNPLLTDIMQLSYSTYYFLPIIFCLALKFHKKHDAFDRSVFLIILCFYLSYIGYLIFPAIGPRFTLNSLQSVELKGFLVGDIIKETLNRLEGIKRDAFPSGHTAITVVVIYLAARYERLLFRIYLPAGILLIISTVYCRYHYVIDVIAGIALAVVSIYIGEKYYNIWYKKNNLP